MELIEGKHYRLKIKTWRQMLDDGKRLSKNSRAPYINTVPAFTSRMESKMPEDRIIVCKLQYKSTTQMSFQWIVPSDMTYSIYEDMIQKILQDNQID